MNYFYLTLSVSIVKSQCSRQHIVYQEIVFAEYRNEMNALILVIHTEMPFFLLGDLGSLKVAELKGIKIKLNILKRKKTDQDFCVWFSLNVQNLGNVLVSFLL